MERELRIAECVRERRREAVAVRKAAEVAAEVAVEVATSRSEAKKRPAGRRLEKGAHDDDDCNEGETAKPRSGPQEDALRKATMMMTIVMRWKAHKSEGINVALRVSSVLIGNRAVRCGV